MIWIVSVIICISITVLCNLNPSRIIKNISCSKNKYEYVSIDNNWYILKNTETIDSCVADKFKDPVVYNFNTHIYHDMDCEWSKQCIESCAVIERYDAEKYGRRCYECSKIEEEEIRNYKPDDYPSEDRFGIEN